MKAKSEHIEAQIAELKAKLQEQKRKEADALEAEMLRWVRKAGCQEKVISLAKGLIRKKEAESSNSAEDNE